MMRRARLLVGFSLLLVGLADPSAGQASHRSAAAKERKKDKEKNREKAREKAKEKIGETVSEKASEKASEKEAAATPAEPITYPNPDACAALPSEMSCIPGGEFIRGVNHRGSNARPAESVWVQTFYMDKYHVTYEQFQNCVHEGKCKPAHPSYPDFNHPHQPMTKVSFYDAMNYCKVHGKHLPTESEWEKAARSTDGRMYSWGNEPITCKRAIFFDQQGRSCGVKQRSREPDKGKPWDVGSRPPGAYGLYDMTGNSWAWVLDWYSPSYAACGKDCEGVDPKGPCQGEEPCPGHKLRIVRGGSWYWGPAQATTYYRRAVPPINAHHFGFRCAASVEEAATLTKSNTAVSVKSDKDAKSDKSASVSVPKG